MAKKVAERDTGAPAEKPVADEARPAVTDVLGLTPLIAQSAAAMATLTAVGLSISGQIASAFFGVLQDSMEATNRLNKPASTGGSDAAQPNPVPAAPQETPEPSRAEAPAPARPARKARAKTGAAEAPAAPPASKSPAKARTRSPARRSGTAVADDLKRISGIGPKLEKVLNDMGVTQFAQIAGWREDEVAKFDKALGFEGRIGRDDWIGQARKLMQ